MLSSTFATLTVAAVTGTANMAAQEADQALASNPDTAGISVSGVTKHITEGIEKRAETVIPKTVYARTWYDIACYTGCAAIVALAIKERAHFAGKLNGLRGLFNSGLFNFRK